MTFLYRRPEAAWFAAALPFLSLAYQHARLDLASDPQAALDLVIYPFLSLPFLLAGGLLDLWFDRRGWRTSSG